MCEATGCCTARYPTTSWGTWAGVALHTDRQYKGLFWGWVSPRVRTSLTLPTLLVPKLKCEPSARKQAGTRPKTGAAKALTVLLTAAHPVPKPAQTEGAAHGVGGGTAKPRRIHSPMPFAAPTGVHSAGGEKPRRELRPGTCSRVGQIRVSLGSQHLPESPGGSCPPYQPVPLRRSHTHSDHVGGSAFPSVPTRRMSAPAPDPRLWSSPQATMWPPTAGMPTCLPLRLHAEILSQLLHRAVPDALLVGRQPLRKLDLGRLHGGGHDAHWGNPGREPTVASTSLASKRRATPAQRRRRARADCVTEAAPGGAF